MIHTHVTVCIPLENREVCTREYVLCTEKYVKRRISKKKKKKLFWHNSAESMNL